MILNRIISVILILIFANFVLVGSVLAAAPNYSTNLAEQLQARNIDYALPYPGILPDSPIYFLKVVRDRVVSFLIVDRVKKAFYALLLSDKRLAAGEVLVNTGKTTLGVTTVVNGEEYFAEAVDQASGTVKDKKEVGDLTAKLMVAVTKHEEVISGMMNKVSGDEAARLAKAFDSNQKSRNRVMGLLGARN